MFIQCEDFSRVMTMLWDLSPSLYMRNAAEIGASERQEKMKRSIKLVDFYLREIVNHNQEERRQGTCLIS